MKNIINGGNLNKKEKPKLLMTYNSNLGKIKEMTCTDIKSGKEIHSCIINKLIDMKIL